MSNKHLDLFLACLGDLFLASHVAYVVIRRARHNSHLTYLLDIRQQVLNMLLLPLEKSPEEALPLEDTLRQLYLLKGEATKPGQKLNLQRMESLIIMLYAWVASNRPVVVVPPDVADHLLSTANLPAMMRDLAVPGINAQACVLYQFPDNRSDLPPMMLFMQNTDSWLPVNITWCGMFLPPEKALLERLPLSEEARKKAEEIGITWFKGGSKLEKMIELTRSKFLTGSINLVDYIEWFGALIVPNDVDVETRSPLWLASFFDEGSPSRAKAENVLKIIHGLPNVHMRIAKGSEQENKVPPFLYPSPRIVTMKS